MSILVNGEHIDDALIRQEASLIKERLFADSPDQDPLCIEIEARERAREYLIEQCLIRQAACQDPAPLPPEAIDAAIRQIQSQCSTESVGVFLSSAQNLRPRVEADLRIDRLFANLTANLPRPRTKEIADYYRHFQNRFFMPEMVHAAHVVKNVDERTDEPAAFQAITAAKRELENGASFAEVADAFSDCPGRGGDLGFFARGQMVDEFETVAFRLAPGEISEIFRSPFGFHIAAVYERQPERMRSLSEARPEIEQLLMDQKKHIAIARFVEQLRAKADIRKVKHAAPQSAP